MEQVTSAELVGHEARQFSAPVSAQPHPVATPPEKQALAAAALAGRYEILREAGQ